jgi:hypothetical protein
VYGRYTEFDTEQFRRPEPVEPDPQLEPGAQSEPGQQPDPTEELGPPLLVDPGPEGVELHDELSDDPFADDLDEQLAARAPRRWANRATLVLAGLVLLTGGFLAGAQVQKHFGAVAAGGGQGQTAGAGLNAGNFGGGRNQNGGGNQNGAQGGTANVRTGTVKLVDGSTIYIQTSDNQVITVRTNGSTAVQLTQPGSLTDLAPGAQVSIEGPAGSDGTVTATRVSRAK